MTPGAARETHRAGRVCRIAEEDHAADVPGFEFRAIVQAELKDVVVRKVRYGKDWRCIDGP